MGVRRTVSIKLKVADSDADLLNETISEFLWAANYVIDHAWKGEYKTTSKADHQRETYDDVRSKTRFRRTSSKTLATRPPTRYRASSPAGSKKFHAWAFRRLFEYVEYKVGVVGISVEQVSPAYTSQQCSKCGFTYENNRPTSNGQDVFECLKCGYSPHADDNAGKNIGLRHLRSAQKSSGGGAPVNVRLNRGILNVNGDYEPAVDGGQNGSSRESPTLNEANGEAVSG